MKWVQWSIFSALLLHAGAQEPTKLTSEEVSPAEEEVTVVQNIQIRARSSADPVVSSGTKPQVN